MLDPSSARRAFCRCQCGSLDLADMADHEGHRPYLICRSPFLFGRECHGIVGLLRLGPQNSPAACWPFAVPGFLGLPMAFAG